MELLRVRNADKSGIILKISAYNFECIEPSAKVVARLQHIMKIVMKNLQN
jgi:hypothetical protein